MFFSPYTSVPFRTPSVKTRVLLAPPLPAKPSTEQIFSAAPLGLDHGQGRGSRGCASGGRLTPGYNVPPFQGWPSVVQKIIGVHWCEFVVPATRVLRRLSILGVLRKCAANNDFRRIRFAAGPRIGRPFRAGFPRMTMTFGSAEAQEISLKSAPTGR